jgi:hypothetical protein
MCGYSAGEYFFYTPTNTANLASVRHPGITPWTFKISPALRDDQSGSAV